VKHGTTFTITFYAYFIELTALLLSVFVQTTCFHIYFTEELAPFHYYWSWIFAS